MKFIKICSIAFALLAILVEGTLIQGQEAILPDQSLMEPSPFPLRRFGAPASVYDRTLAIVAGKIGEPLTTYVYDREADSKVWNLVGPLERPGPPYGDDLKPRIKVFSNDTIFVPADFQGEDCTEGDCGKVGVYVYRKVDGIWKPVQFFQPDPVEDFFFVGEQLEVAGDTLFISAPEGLLEGDSKKGAVYAFKEVDGQWVQTKIIVGEGVEDWFGAYMAAHDDVLAVLQYPDKIYVFERNAGGPDNWGQVAVLKNEGIDTNIYYPAVWGDVVAGYLDVFGDISDQLVIHHRDEGGDGNWGEKKRINLDFPGYPGSVSYILMGKDTIYVSKRNWDLPDMIPVYIFKRHHGGQDNWGLAQTFTPTRYREFERAIAVDTHNDIAIFANAAWQNDTGEVYSYIPDSALAYGLWVDAWKDPVSGSRFTGIGWLDDADWPYVFLYKDAQWLYILEEFSSLNNFFGYHMGKGSWIWSADNYGGWYYRYSDLMWDQF